MEWRLYCKVRALKLRRHAGAGKKDRDVQHSSDYSIYLPGPPLTWRRLPLGIPIVDFLGWYFRSVRQEY